MHRNSWKNPWNITSWTIRTRKLKESKIELPENCRFDKPTTENPIADNIKLVQNLAYKPTADKDKNIPFKISRFLSTNITKLSDDQLSRLSYSCSKGSFNEPALIDLIGDEVLHRLNKMSTYHLFRFLQSLSSIYLFNKIKSNLIGSEFLKIISQQILKDLPNINCVNLSQLISILDVTNLLDDQVVKKLNLSLHFKLKYASNPDYFIYPVLSLALAGKISLLNASLSLKQCYRLSNHLLTYKSSDLGCNEMTQDIKKVNNYLLPIKLFDYILRFDLPQIYKSLETPAKSFLSSVENKLVKMDYSYGDPGFISFELRKSVSRSNYNLISHIQGPYLLDLCDPIDKVVLEWDKPWLVGSNVDNWNTLFYSKWTDAKRRHLRHLGYKILKIPVNSTRNNNGM